MLISTGQYAKRYGVTSQSVRRWIEAGRLDATRTPTGQWRIEIEEPLMTYLYARVSSSKQKSSIETQRRLLEEAYPDGKFVFDIGFGFNFKRRSFVRLLEQVMSGDPIKIVATTPDRISRSGLAFIDQVVEFHGGEIVFLEDDDRPKSFDTATLIAYLTSFCNSQSGKRNSRRSKKDTDLS